MPGLGRAGAVANFSRPPVSPEKNFLTREKMTPPLVFLFRVIITDK
jgi:hypothetical protein